MERRKFVRKSIGGAFLGGVFFPGSILSGEGMKSHQMMKDGDIPMASKTDVIVCGGGPSGFSAAVSAARSGARVRLFELQGCLGGTWTTGLMTHFIDTENKKGLMEEILDVQHSAGVIQPTIFDVEVTKLWLEQESIKAGVELFYHTRVVNTIVEKGRITAVITENANGRMAWPATLFIDATGNGDLAAKAGCGFDFGHPDTGIPQPLSLNVLLTGIHLKDLQEKKLIGIRGYKENLLAEIKNAGSDCSYSKPSLFAIRDDLFSMMSNHQYNVKPWDSGELTMATIEARSELHHQVNALRKMGGIWKNVRIIASADHIGIREGRRIHGLYTLTLDDLMKGSRFDDAVCRASFDVDVHALDPDKNKGIDHGFHVEPYDIPLRSLIAKDVDGLMMVGRCISGDFFAHASYRVTGNAVSMGESAGKVAAVAIKERKLPQDVLWEPET